MSSRSALLLAMALATAVALGLVARPGPSLAQAGLVSLSCPDARTGGANGGDGWPAPPPTPLTGADVQSVEGRLSLVCRYGLSGSLTRPAPAHMTCAPGDRGFACAPETLEARAGRAIEREPSLLERLPFIGGARSAPAPGRRAARPTAAPALLLERSIKLPQGYVIDLESGRQTFRKGGDLWFEGDGSMDSYLTPRDGVGIAVVGREQPGYAGCASVEVSARRVETDSLSGKWLCARTHAGRLAEVFVNSVVGGGVNVMTLNYRLWK